MELPPATHKGRIKGPFMGAMALLCLAVLRSPSFCDGNGRGQRDARRPGDRHGDALPFLP
jgi:hypothetical protein